MEDRECQMKESGLYSADHEWLKNDVEMTAAGQLTEAAISKHPLLLVRSDHEQVIFTVDYLNSTSAAKKHLKNNTLSFTNEEWMNSANI